MKRSLLIALFVLSAWGAALAQSAAEPATAAQPDAKLVHPPIPTFQPEAKFSAEAKRKKIGGICRIGLIVDAAGNPHVAKVFRCSDPVFYQSSLDAVAKYRFKPATTAEGKPVPVLIQVEVKYQAHDGSLPMPSSSINVSFNPPPDIQSPEPERGIYPFSKLVTPPAMVDLSDRGFGEQAMGIDGNSACDVVLTIDAEGKPSNPHILRCDNPRLENAAEATLLDSLYKPGSMNGKAVPIRVTVHLEFAGFGPAN